MIFASSIISLLPQLPPEDIYTISFWVSCSLFFLFFFFQFKNYKETIDLIQKYCNFFKRKRDYEKSIDQEGKIQLFNYSDNDSYLYELIKDINEYLMTCRGTATFSIFQNKTERRLTMRYDEATSKMSFPTHLGLMGTFVGVFIGLLFFLWASSGPDGITDEAIHSLITGVLVSMSTSFFGLLMSIDITAKASKARKNVDFEKNIFYEFVQNKVMGYVDTSLADALASLHDTVATFEPQFSTVIKGFKETFEQCTVAFGDDFRKSVTTLVTAVDSMGENMDVVNQNVDLLKELIQRMSGGEMVRYMRSFSDAADHIQTVTESLDDFERARRMMLAAAQEAINIQKSYNESLKIPQNVASSINTILTRVSTFEKSINDLGEHLNTTQMFTQRQMEAIEQIVNAIKRRQKIAVDFGKDAGTKLEAYYNEQINLFSKMYGKYNQQIQQLYDQYEKLINDHIKEINERHEAFKLSINKTFNLEECRQEFAELKKIHVIESTTRRIEDKTMSAETMSKKFNNIEKAIDNIQIPESKGFLGIGGSSKNNKTEDKPKPPVKTGTAKTYEPPVKPEKTARELLKEMGLDKDDSKPQTTPKPQTYEEDVELEETTQKKKGLLRRIFRI